MIQCCALIGYRPNVRPLLLFFFRHKDGIWLFVFISEYIDIDLILLFNFVILLGGDLEFNSRVIQFVDVFFIRFFDSLQILVLRVQVSDVTPSEAFIIIVFQVD